MRGGGFADGTDEAAARVEQEGRSRAAHPEARSAGRPRGIGHRFHQQPADARPPRGAQHVQAAHPADQGIPQIGVGGQAADPQHAILAEGAGAALDVVARLVGLEGAARFVHALLVAIGSCFVAVGTAVAGAVAYRLLTVR